jgi:hypothetical protein
LELAKFLGTSGGGGADGVTLALLVCTGFGTDSPDRCSKVCLRRATLLVSIASDIDQYCIKETEAVTCFLLYCYLCCFKQGMYVDNETASFNIHCCSNQQRFVVIRIVVANGHLDAF